VPEMVRLATVIAQGSGNGLPFISWYYMGVCTRSTASHSTDALSPAGPLVSAATLASEESKVTIQNRPTVLNTGEYVGELR
jgi:hypothetical protein